MTIQRIIRADVFDIVDDMPHSGDVFLVDTNVWYWYIYVSQRQSSHGKMLHQKNNAKPYQLRVYPDYEKKSAERKTVGQIVLSPSLAGRIGTSDRIV